MSFLQELGEEVILQSDRCTAHPMFVVQERKLDYGYDPDYADDYHWLNAANEYEIADPVLSRHLDNLYQASGNTPRDWQKTYYRERWEFVTACFSEKGCEEFINVDGHNHGELRIYATSAHRNMEFRKLRDFLMVQGTVQPIGLGEMTVIMLGLLVGFGIFLVGCATLWAEFIQATGK